MMSRTIFKELLTSQKKGEKKEIIFVPLKNLSFLRGDNSKHIKRLTNSTI